MILTGKLTDIQTLDNRLLVAKYRGGGGDWVALLDEVKNLYNTHGHAVGLIYRALQYYPNQGIAQCAKKVFNDHKDAWLVSGV